MERTTTFSEWMRAARLRAGLTQEEVALRGDFDDSYVNKIERGKIRLPNLETRQRIHAALGTTEHELIALGIVRPHHIVNIPTATGTGEALAPTVHAGVPDPLAALFADFYGSLSPRQRQLALRLARRAIETFGIEDEDDRQEPAAESS